MKLTKLEKSIIKGIRLLDTNHLIDFVKKMGEIMAHQNEVKKWNQN